MSIYQAIQCVVCHVLLAIQARLDSCVSMYVRVYVAYQCVFQQLFLSTAVTPGLRPQWDSDSSSFLCALHQLLKDFHFNFNLKSKNNLQFGLRHYTGHARFCVTNKFY